MKGDIGGANLKAGWADAEKKAVKLAEEGEDEQDCDQHHNAAGPMAAVLSPSKPEYDLED